MLTCQCNEELRDTKNDKCATSSALLKDRFSSMTLICSRAVMILACTPGCSVDKVGFVCAASSCPSNDLTNALPLSLCLSRTHTHARTHPHSLSLSLSLPRTFFTSCRGELWASSKGVQILASSTRSRSMHTRSLYYIIIYIISIRLSRILSCSTLYTVIGGIPTMHTVHACTYVRSKDTS